MTEAKHLVVNADDFGLSLGVNRGIVKAFEQGILTSTSLMVRQPAAAAAAEYGRAHRKLSVGLHVDLGEYVFTAGEWRVKYQFVPMSDAAQVEAEVGRQLACFEELMQAPPTHLDSHQHVHRNEPVRSILVQAAQRLNVPLRECSPRVRFCGDFYGQSGEGEPYPEGISVENLLRLLRDLKPGWTELGCHPGQDPELDSVYCREREVELASLCHARVQAAVQELGIALRSFADFGQAERGAGVASTSAEPAEPIWSPTPEMRSLRRPLGGGSKGAA